MTENEPYKEIQHNGKLLRFYYNAAEGTRGIDILTREIYTEPSYTSDKCHIEPDDVVLDGGANIGLFTIRALADGASHVIAVEPSPKALVLLKKNIEVNGYVGKVTIIDKALWNEIRETDKKLYFHEASELAGSYVTGDRRRRHSVETTTVDEITKDCLRIDFIKFDLERSDQQALAGTLETIKKHKPKLALSLYHRGRDKHVMPETIQSLNVGYGKPENVGIHNGLNNFYFLTGLWSRPAASPFAYFTFNHEGKEYKACYNVVDRLKDMQFIVKEIFELQNYTSDKCQINSGDIVLDGGANIGLFALFACSKGASKVIAVEPNSHVMECAKQTIALNGFTDKCIFISKALWYEDRGRGHRLRFMRWKHSVSCYVAEVAMGRFTNYVDGVTVDTLNKEYGPIDFIKFDLEGCEQQAMAGAVETVKQNRPNLALCLYHKESDKTEIPAIVHGWNLGYGAMEVQATPLRTSRKGVRIVLDTGLFVARNQNPIGLFTSGETNA